MNKSHLDRAFLYGGPIFLLLIMNGLNLYLLNFLAPQVTFFLMEVSPIHQNTSQEAYDHFYKYAIACEACIFLLTAIGEVRAAKWFIVVSVVTQFLYMHRWDSLLPAHVWEDRMLVSSGIRLLLGSFIFSIMAQIAMWFLAELIKKTLDRIMGLLSRAEPNRASSEIAFPDLNEPVLAEELKINDSEPMFKVPHHSNSQKLEFECKHCEASFETHSALNGHLRIHSERKLSEMREIVTI